MRVRRRLPCLIRSSMTTVVVADLLVEYVGRRWFEGTDVSRYSSLANRVLMVNEEALRDEDAALAS